MNWGYRIALFFVAFISFMAFMFYKCLQQDFDLVTEDYYAQEIAYQTIIDQQENANKLEKKPALFLAENKFEIQFFDKIKEGKVYVFRPSDDELDFEQKLVLDEMQKHYIGRSKFQKGLYKIKLQWEQDDSKQYYMEESLYIP